MGIHAKKKSIHFNLKLLFSFGVVMLPFLYQYKGIGTIMSFGELLIGALTIVILLNRRTLILKNINASLLGFYCITLILTLVCFAFPYFKVNNAYTTVVRLFFYAIIIYVGREYFSLVYIKKIYYSAVFIFSTYLIIQYMYHSMNGGYLPIYLNYDWQFPPEMKTESLEMIYRYSFRASSLFFEPSYFAFYTLPAVCILIFQTRKNHFEKATLITSVIALALSTATSGIIGLIVIFAVYCLGKAGNSKRKKFGIIFSAIIMSILYFTLLENVSMWTTLRMFSGGSFNTRISRGVLVYNQLPVLHKIIGVGLNNLENYMNLYGLSTIYDEGNLNYMSSVIQTFNYSGIIGFIALLLYYYSFWNMVRHNKYNLIEKENTIFDEGLPIAMFALFIFISCYESILFTYRFAYLVILMEGTIQYCRDF